MPGTQSAGKRLAADGATAGPVSLARSHTAHEVTHALQLWWAWQRVSIALCLQCRRCTPRIVVDSCEGTPAPSLWCFRWHVPCTGEPALHLARCVPACLLARGASRARLLALSTARTATVMGRLLDRDAEPTARWDALRSANRGGKGDSSTLTRQACALYSNQAPTKEASRMTRRPCGA